MGRVELANYCSGNAGEDQLVGLLQAFAAAGENGTIYRNEGFYGIDPAVGSLAPLNGQTCYGPGQFERVGDFVKARLPNPSRRFLWAETGVDNFHLVGEPGIPTFLGHGDDIPMASGTIAADVDADDTTVLVDVDSGTFPAAARVTVGGANPGVFGYTSYTGPVGGVITCLGCDRTRDWTAGDPANEFVGNFALTGVRTEQGASGETNKNWILEDVSFDHWPGPQTGLVAVEGLVVRGMTFDNGYRGGLIVWLNSSNLDISGIRATDNYDDIVAFHSLAASSTADHGQLTTVRISDVIGSSSDDPDQVTNNGIVINGAVDVRLRDAEITGAGSDRAIQKSGLSIHGANNNLASGLLFHHPANIDVDDCTFTDSHGYGIHIFESTAAGQISIGSNVTVSDTYQESIVLGGHVDEEEADEDADTTSDSTLGCRNLQIIARCERANLAETALEDTVAVTATAQVPGAVIRIRGNDPDVNTRYLVNVEGHSDVEVSTRATASHYQTGLVNLNERSAVVPWPRQQDDKPDEFVDDL